MKDEPLDGVATAGLLLRSFDTNVCVPPPDGVSACVFPCGGVVPSGFGCWLTGVMSFTLVLVFVFTELPVEVSDVSVLPPVARFMSRSQRLGPDEAVDVLVVPFEVVPVSKRFMLEVKSEVGIELPMELPEEPREDPV
jgi:hypothetical protein